MIDPLKIVVCSLKSVKWLPVSKNDSPVMNSTARLDSLVVNTPWGVDFLVYFEQASEQLYKKISS
jgi:hypothetical protein